MKVRLEMTNVSACDAEQCVYNADKACHARAITVGNGSHAACDTFMQSGQHTKNRTREAGVGACKVTSCRHNSDFECEADAIRVGVHHDHADCVTFEPR